MTKRRDLKARVRDRMTKTGEGYAAARRHVASAKPSRTPSQSGHRERGGARAAR